MQGSIDLRVVEIPAAEREGDLLRRGRDSDQVEGHRLQLTNPDGSRTFAAIYRHGTRLYILEATVPTGAPAPGLFQQSLHVLDEEGKADSLSSRSTPPAIGQAWRFPAPPPPRTGAAPACRSVRASIDSAAVLLT